MRQLIEPADLDLLRGDPRLLIVHVASPAAYTVGHIHGAILVSPAELVSGDRPASGTLPSLDRLTTLFSRIGYSNDRHIVAYDDEGGGWAGRFIWTLDIIGHGHWSYLNGGIRAWTAEGRAVDTAPVLPQRRTTHIEIHAGPSADAEEILQRLDDPELLVWDCRSVEEHRGQKSGSARAGHIPRAVHLDWLDLMDARRGLRVREDLAALLTSRGITPDRDVVTHCQTHHRSGLSYLVARLLGYPRIRAYPGSWADWGNRGDTPVALGP